MSAILELQPQEIVNTARALHARIEARFAGSGLGALCQEPIGIAENSLAVRDRINRPDLGLRLGIGAFVLLVLGMVAVVASNLRVSFGAFSLPELVSLVEAISSELVLLAAAFTALVTLETRIKRQRVIQAIQTLRFVAHIIEM